MAIPLGVSVVSRSAPPTRGVLTDTATWYAVGTADIGPVDSATRIRSLADFAFVYGARSAANELLYDSLDAFFREGGGVAYVARAVGSDATAASITLQDTAGEPANTVVVTAKHPGGYGNGLKVAVANGGSAVVLTVTDAEGNVLETSPSLASRAAVIAWDSNYVVITPTGSSTLLPKTSTATALSGGDSDLENIADEDYADALALFVKKLGPGQVSIPGRSGEDIYAALWAHAAANNRVVVGDVENTTSVVTLVGLAGDVPQDATQDYGALFGPWPTIPGVSGSPANRVVPASPVIAALCARVDREGRVNRAAAGDDWPLQYVLDFYDFSEADREVLLNAGVNTFKDDYGVLVNWGFQTTIQDHTDPFWQFNCVRLRMRLVGEALVIGSGYLFKQIDGRGFLLRAFGSDLAAMMLAHYVNDELYGETPEDAFSVDSVTVNTDDTIAQGEVVAVVSFTPSLYARSVQIQLVTIPIS